MSSEQNNEVKCQKHRKERRVCECVRVCVLEAMHKYVSVCTCESMHVSVHKCVIVYTCVRVCTV